MNRRRVGHAIGECWRAAIGRVANGGARGGGGNGDIDGRGEDSAFGQELCVGHAAEISGSCVRSTGRRFAEEERRPRRARAAVEPRRKIKRAVRGRIVQPVKGEHIRARNERGPPSRQVDCLRRQGIEQRPRAGGRGIKGGGGRRQPPGHLGSIEIGYEPIVRGQRKRERFHRPGIGNLERDPHVGRGIHVLHRRAKVGSDAWNARGRRCHDGEPTGRRIADQLEETRETRGGAGRGGKLDFIAAGRSEVGENEFVVSRGEGPGAEGIGERARAGDLHDHGAIDPEAEPVVRTDVECPWPVRWDDECAGGFDGEVLAIAAVERGNSVAEAAIKAGAADEVDDWCHGGEVVHGIGPVEQSLRAGDVCHGHRRRPLLNRKPEHRHAKSRAGRPGDPVPGRRNTRLCPGQAERVVRWHEDAGCGRWADQAHRVEWDTERLVGLDRRKLRRILARPHHSARHREREVLAAGIELEIGMQVRRVRMAVLPRSPDLQKPTRGHGHGREPPLRRIKRAVGQEPAVQIHRLRIRIVNLNPVGRRAILVHNPRRIRCHDLRDHRRRVGRKEAEERT